MVAINIKMIFLINLVGLIASFVARQLLKKSGVSSAVPTLFLYLSTIVSMYVIFNQEKAVEVKNEPIPELILPPVEQKVLGTFAENTDFLESKWSFNQGGINLTKVVLSKFDPEVNTLGDGNICITVFDENKTPIAWQSYSEVSKSLTNDEIKLGINITRDKYLGEIKLDLTNQTNLPKSLTLVVSHKTSNADLPQLNANNSKEIPSKPRQISNPNWAGFTHANYWATYTFGDFDRALFTNEPENRNSIRLEKAIVVESNSNKAIKFNLLNGPSQINELREYNTKLDTDLMTIADLDYGIFGFIRKLVLIPILIAFESITKALRHPLLGVLVLVLCVKLIVLYNSYRSHSFAEELGKVMQLATAGNNPDAIRNAFMNNQNLNFKSKIISVVVKLVAFMLFYRLFDISPLFVGSRFLWINDLSKPDSLRLNNLFGLFPLGDMLPRITILAVILGSMMFIEMSVKNRRQGATNKDQQLPLLVVPVILVFIFSNMKSVLALYIIMNTILDNLQNFIFDSLAKRKK